MGIAAITGKVTVVIGLQRGDEGKGRVVDELAETHDIVARFNGGPNAGHTVVLPDGTELDLHLIPSGVAHPGTMNVIGNGCYLDPIKLLGEFEHMEEKGVIISPDILKISDSVHLILPQHIQEDTEREAGAGAQGSTKSGIAQVARDKYYRTGITLGHALEDSETKASLPVDYQRAIDTLAPYVDDTVLYLNNALRAGKNILAEGAQGFLLDVDHGMYPFVTSSSTATGGAVTGLGIPPQVIGDVFGIVKATQSHVGGGVFVTEITDEELLARLRGKQGAVDAEFGTTTGRARRMGHLDLPQLRRAIDVCGVTQLVLTKVDCVPRYGDTITICERYESSEIAPASQFALEQQKPVYTQLGSWSEDISSITDFSALPKNAQDYITYVETRLATPITRIGVGPGRQQVIKRT
ncbi:MAG TPA: adenylosuccinate synthetase [Candidatus Saccharimonadales bacterium]